MANEVKIKMTADDLASGKIKGVGKSAQTATDKLRGMRGQFLLLGAAGGALLGALGLTVKTFAQVGDEIQKMSLRTALTTEVLSEYKFALEQSGSTIEGFEKSIRRMSSFIQDGRDGLTTTTDALDTLGVSVKDLEGLGVEDAFVFLSSALANVEDDITQAALAQDLFGRSGTALLPLLAQGADGIAALREEAQDLGIVFDQDMANSAARLIDAQNTMTKSVQGLQIAFGEHLAPALSSFLEGVGKGISAVSEWAKENPVLTQTLVVLAGVFGTMAIAIAGLGIAIPLATMAFGALGVAVAGTSLAFIGFNVATGGLLIAIGLAVTALIAGLVLLVQNWDKVLRAIKIGVNFLIGAFEAWANSWIHLINEVIKGANKLAVVFGKEIDTITELELDRLDTSMKEVAETTEEVAEGIGDSMGDMQDDFKKTADTAEEEAKRTADAWIDSMKAIEDAQSEKVRTHIEMSKQEEALFARGEIYQKSKAKTEKDLADAAMALAMEEAEAIVAASNKRFEDIRVARETDLAHDLNVAGVRVDAGTALEEENMAAFEEIRKSVSTLPSLKGMTQGAGWMGGIGIKDTSPGTVTAMGVLNSLGAAAGFNASGQLTATSITGKQVHVRDVNVSVNVEGDMLGEDMENKITAAMQEAMQKGVFTESGGSNPGGES